MNEAFDIIIVGSGPTAIAALDSIDRRQRIAVVTGGGNEKIPSQWLHAKIMAVSAERGEAAGVAEPLPTPFPGGKPLFSTAIEGGLANYWGQQFLRYEEGDAYPRKVFENHQDYLTACAAIERLFHLAGGDEITGGLQIAPDYVVRVPRLLMGSCAKPGIGLEAMREVFSGTEKIAVLRTRADKLERVSASRWKVHLASGEIVVAPRILLAAGVVGTGRLLLRSFESVRAFALRDHAPWMVYASGLGPIHALRPPGAPRHFNALTIERVTGNRTRIFASLYNMGRAELNLLLASTVGRSFTFLKGWPAPPGASLLQPVQIWTENTYAEVEIDRAGQVKDFTPHKSADAGLTEALTVLSTLGGHCHKVSHTLPGYGFHYHGSRLRLSDDSTTDIAPFLKNVSDGAVVPIDASTLPEIGLRPHTLTAMAVARQLTLQMQ